jgi:hypothetical protein
MKSRCLFLFAISLLFFILSHAQQSQDSLVKLSPRLQAIQNSMRLSEGNDSITLVLTVKDLKLFQQEIAFLKILSVYTPAQTILVSGRKKDLFHILKDDNIVFADVLRKPYEEITTGAPDLTTNKINYLHRRFPDVNGEAITISIKENRFDKEDIDLKGRWITGSNESPSASAHASIMATVIAGGGNSSPAAKGVAWGARVVSSDFSTLLPDADTIYRHHNISIQNHSYGVGIENFYGSDAVAFDISVVNNPSLVHVFSAGNAGTQVSAAGLYTGVRGFANLTGSFKMAKNVIVVGAVDSFGNVVSPSSKGPAFDGRIKPDLRRWREFRGRGCCFRNCCRFAAGL